MIELLIESPSQACNELIVMNSIPNTKPSLTIAMVVGEASGDLLGAGLMEAIRKRVPDCHFVGIGGEKMHALGFKSFYPMERLAVMGIADVLPRLRELLKMRKELAQRLCVDPPNLFIGIDAPDFNLGLETMLKQAGQTTAHYVSPSVWAWRQGRIKKIKKAVDLMLTLFPFEAQFYQQHDSEVAFVGHPLADQIPLTVDQQEARISLNLPVNKPLLAVLPGSRKGELKHLAPTFIKTMLALKQHNPELEFVVPAANSQRYEQFSGQLREIAPSLKVTLIEGQAHTVMAAADVVLLTSGTATLEAMLLKRPMVVAYKWGWLSHLLISPWVKTPFISLPNLLAGERLVEEFVQKDMLEDNLTQALLRCFESEEVVRLQRRFDEIHRELKCNASEQAATALLKLID